nr:MAG: putative RNA-dependent RNA polymerase [Trichoderma gamsii negative-stranded virus 1]
MATRGQFLDFNFAFRLWESTNRFYRKQTYKVIFCRVNVFDFLKNSSDYVIVTPVYTYYPRELLIKFKDSYKKETGKEGKVSSRMIMSDSLINYEAEFTEEDELFNVFSEAECRENLASVMSKGNSESKRVITSKEVYWKGFLASSQNQGLNLLRYNLLPEEGRFLAYIMGMMKYVSMPDYGDLVDPLKVMDSCKITQGIISDSYMEIFKKERIEDMEKALTVESDFKTRLTEMVTEELTYRKFKFWEKSRHNIFASTVEMLSAGEIDYSNIEKNFDMNVAEMFDYYGIDYQKTPDMIKDMGDSILIIDYAVTTVDPGWIRENKIKYYNDLAAGLSKHLKKDVKVEAIVLKISGNMSLSLPENYYGLYNQILDSDNVRFLRDIHLQMVSFPNYEKFRSISDREFMDEEQRNIFITEPLNKVILSKLSTKTNFSKMRTIPMEMSRTDEVKDVTKFKKFLDTEWAKEVRKEVPELENPYTQVQKYLDVMNNIYNSGTIPESLKDIFSKTTEELSEAMDMSIDDQVVNRKKYLDDLNKKLPKVFKMPLIDLTQDSMPSIYDGYVPSWFPILQVLDDGSVIVDSNYDFKETVLEEEAEAEKKYDIDGIGIDPDLDISLVENILEDMLSSREPSSNDSYSDFDDDPVRMLRSKGVWPYLEFFSDLAMNLCYMEGRRNIAYGLKLAEDTHSVMKNFGKYFLMVKGGSKMTSQKQIRFKVICHSDSLLGNNPFAFHSFKEFSMSEDLVETKWLTMSVTDLRHFVRIKEVAISLTANMITKVHEENRGKKVMLNYPMKSLMTSILVLLEHKRGTSTTLQLNRYLLHSVTSYITNKVELIKDINSSPIRSRIESYIRFMQVSWYRQMLEKSHDLQTQRVLNMYSTSTSYDRFKTLSFFDFSQEVEFSILMDEMYICNLFDKEAGFTSHRMKQVVEKMTVAEMKFEKIKKKPISQGKIDDIKKFLLEKDTLHTFDKNFVITATKLYFDQEVNRSKVATAISKAMAATVDSAMMMSASLVEGPFQSEVLKFNDVVVKDKTFVTLFRLAEELSASVLSEMCNRFDKLDAVFTIFPKAQIGGPREILIMHFKLRIMVKFLETISRELCSIHPKEMLTKNDRKAEIQSSKMAEYKEILNNNKKIGRKGIVMSLNADASKWAPGFVMEHFSYFVEHWDIPEEIKNFLHTVLSSFSNKTILVPEVLKDKWARKPVDQVDYLDGVESFKQETLKNGGFVNIKSGMGQGMLHFLSSFYHAVMDDLMDMVVKEFLKMKFGVTIQVSTLLSSDDKTKIILILFDKGIDDCEEVIKWYMITMDCMSRLCNIHFNWKKSGLNLIICEFNSLFSVGKRMMWATIKDIYTAHIMPDLTSPEEACVFMLSNIRRCMEHGMYIKDLELMLRIARRMILLYYRIDSKLVNVIKMKLDCRDEDLPVSLGFLPYTFPLETLIVGPEIHMYNPNNSISLNRYYYNLYSANPSKSQTKGKKVVPFSEESCGKYWFELPTRLDKRLIDLKNDFFENDMPLSKEQILKDINKNSLNFNLKRSDPKHYQNFTKSFFIGMNRKYEFQDTMVIHSLVRALQLSKKKGNVFPKTEKLVELEEDMKQLSKELREIREEGRLDMDKENMYLMMKAMIDSYRVDIMAFVDFILDMDPEHSSLFFYESLSKVIPMAMEIQAKVGQFQKSYKNSHSMMRTIRFHMTDNILDVTPNDILKYVFDKSSNPRNMTILAFQKIQSMAGSKLDPFENPFLYIQDIMSNSDSFASEFKDFLNFNLKTYKNQKITMLSDFACRGNIWDNLQAMYLYKTDPDFMLIEGKKSMQENISNLEFLTDMSIKGKMRASLLTEKSTEVLMSDNVLTRAMKVHASSEGNWMESSLMTYTRVEYKSMKAKGYEVKMWTNLNCLIKAFEWQNRAEIYIYCNRKIEEIDGIGLLMSVFGRYMREQKDKGKDIVFKNLLEESERYEVHYNIETLYYRTNFQMRPVNWEISVWVSTTKRIRKDRVDAFPHSTSFKALTDRYTVDSKTLMDMEINDGKNDNIKIKDMLREIPDIKTLNTIFKANNWLSDLKVSSEDSISASTYMDMQAVLDSFGFTDTQQTVSLALGLTTGSNFMTELAKERTDDKDKILEGMNLKDRSKISVLADISQALRESADKSESSGSVEEFTTYERTSIISMMDKVTSRSLAMQIRINKEEINNYYRYLRKTNKSMTAFHNLLYNQLHEAFDNELEDSMVLMLYSIVLRSSATTVNIQPATSLRRRDTSEISITLIEKIEEQNDRFDEAALIME